jgi:DNA polymerase III sliding clamp (beta) subunit (PCNA family)
MRETLDIVRGAVSAKDLVPVLTHFAIHNGRICGYDGRVFIEAPAMGLGKSSFTIEANRFIAAIDACGLDATTVSATVGRCHIEAGSFSAILPTGPFSAFPTLDLPDGGPPIKVRPGFIDALASLRPFVGDDASRPWASGVLLRDGKALATNNIVIVERPLILPTRSFILPSFAIDELTRIGRDPSHITVVEGYARFYLPGDVVLLTRLQADAWPESAMQLIDEFHKDVSFKAVPPVLAQSIDRVKPFCADPKSPIVQLNGTRVSAGGGEMSAEIKGFKSSFGVCAFRIEPLLAVLAHATHVDWSKFPRVPWTDKNTQTRGVIVGLKL